MVDIRPAGEGDLEQLNELYNHYIRETPITFDIEPFSRAQRRAWFSHYGTVGRHRLLVAVDDGTVLGYASSGTYRTKQAYETSVETSIYLRPDATGRGVGRLLYGELFVLLGGEDVHRALAGITLPNPASEALHERMGFRPVGRFTEQGRKFGRYWDVGWYERPVGA